ncbi:MAG: cytochrome P450 [Bacteroidetes bacterium]|nr:cytochrome P450 [Bacteroidota bacterium]
MNSPRLPTGPKGNIIFTAARELRTNVLGLIERHQREYPDISRLRIGPYYYVNVYQPDMIEHILSHSDLYSKGRENANLKYLLGNGLLTNEGEFWMKQRRLIQPVFHKRRLATFVEQIKDCTERLMADWEQHGSTTMDIHAEMTQITLSIVSRTLLSTDTGGWFREISDALGYLMKGLSTETTKLIRLPQWMPTPYNIRMARNREILNKMILGIIADRRATKVQHDDLLSMLMEVEDADTAERMTDAQLRDEVITIFLAGHETTANAMSFALYLMARHPEAAQRIREETAAVLADGPLTYESLMRLDYTTRAVKEVMRLYPPAWIIGREATQDDVIGDYLIKKGDTMMLFPYLTHRMEQYWEEPLRFDPDRFLPERMKDRPRYAYFPFGGGARLCIGNNFAMMEMQLILALICSRYKFSVPDGFRLELEALVTLRPKGELRLGVRRV